MGTKSKWGGNTPKEEWEGLAERTNKYIDLDKINSEQDYYDKLEEVFNNIPRPDGKIPSWFPRKYYSDIAENNKSLQTRIKDYQRESLTALQEAQRYERSRARRSRTKDESKTAKITRPANKKNVRGWIGQRGKRTDIKGVDTRLAKNLATKNLITRADLRLKSFNVSLDKRGIKRYRWASGKLKGRFAPRPYRRR